MTCAEKLSSSSSGLIANWCRKHILPPTVHCALPCLLLLFIGVGGAADLEQEALFFPRVSERDVFFLLSLK